MCKSSVPLNAFCLKEDCRGIKLFGHKGGEILEGMGAKLYFLCKSKYSQGFELLGKELSNEFNEQKLV